VPILQTRRELQHLLSEMQEEELFYYAPPPIAPVALLQWSLGSLRRPLSIVTGTKPNIQTAPVVVAPPLSVMKSRRRHGCIQ